jgi:UDP-N-acetyl-D-mannosaminuronic acid dehydrogenase
MNNKKFVVSVVGMGYVGIPSAMAFASSKDVDFVYGIQRKSERSKHKCDMLNRGENPYPFDDLLGSFIKKYVEDEKFACGSDYRFINKCDAVCVCTQTPVDVCGSNIVPNYDSLKSALCSVADNIKENTIVSIESTITPGSTDGWINELISSRSGLSYEQYYLVHAPERVSPGRSLQNILQIPRCVGGVDSRSTAKGVELYSTVTKPENIIRMTAREAEFTKVAENAVRDVQIATVNQLAMYCELLGINFNNVFRGIDSLKGRYITRSLLQPGAGVGGHCLVKDGLHLEHSVNLENRWLYYGESFPSLFIAAREINDRMPLMVVQSLIGMLVKQETRSKYRVAILGWAFSPDVDDDRNTPSYHFIKFLQRYGDISGIEFDIVVHDPHVKNPSYDVKVYQDINFVLNDADVVVFMTKHNGYFGITPEYMEKACHKKPIVIDGRNVAESDEYIEKGFKYYCIGRGDLR